VLYPSVLWNVCRWQSAVDPLVGCRWVSLSAPIYRTTPQNETAMTTEQGASGGTVSFRTPAPQLAPAPTWVMDAVFAVLWLVPSVGALEGSARDRRDLCGLQLLLGCVGVVVSEVRRQADTRVSHCAPPESAENCVVARTSSGPPQELGQLVVGPAPSPGRQAGKATGAGRH
jgi:hypothetical protein